MSATDTSAHYWFEAKPRMTGKVGAAGVASTIATTIPHTFVGLDEGDAYIVTANRTDSTGTIKNPLSSTETFIGKVSSTNFINCVREQEGTAQAWAADTVLEVLMSATWANKMIAGLEVGHEQTGVHKSALPLTSPVLTTPKVITSINDTNGNELFKVTATASAVNELTVANAATGNSPVLSATGGDTDISIDLTPKGTGRVKSATVNIPTISSTDTFTNKRITKRIVSTASYTTDTGTSLNCDTTDAFIVTAQAGALLFNNPSGTGTQGQPLLIRIKDNGTARALTYGSEFRAMGTALPSTTVLSKTLYMLFIYNSTDTKWDLVAAGQEA